MSLALVQDYSSEEEAALIFSDDSDEDQVIDENIEERNGAEENGLESENDVQVVDPPSNKKSALPSAANAFAEVTGLPEFLKHSVSAQPRPLKKPNSEVQQPQKKPTPPPAVIEAKATHVSVTEQPQAQPQQPQNPALEQLRLCLQCGVPKTYSGAAMICPQCKDRPQDLEKRKGSSKTKDKEKSKRIKGQSSHATWKSETEMQLRQHYD